MSGATEGCVRNSRRARREQPKGVLGTGQVRVEQVGGVESGTEGEGSGAEWTELIAPTIMNGKQPCCFRLRHLLTFSFEFFCIASEYRDLARPTNFLKTSLRISSGDPGTHQEKLHLRGFSASFSGALLSLQGQTQRIQDLIRSPFQRSFGQTQKGEHSVLLMSGLASLEC